MIDEQEENMLNAVYEIVNNVKSNGKSKVDVSIKDGCIRVKLGGNIFLGQDNGDPAPLVASGWVAAILADSVDRGIGISVQLTKKKKSHAVVKITYSPECLAH